MNLSEMSIKRPVFIICIVMLTLVLGFTSVKKMSVDLFPDVTFPIIFVQTLYPGASPQDMEKLVSKPIEDELGSIAGLNKMSSTNAESVSYVILEFKLGSDIKNIEQEVRQRLGNIRRNLPDDIKDPIVRRFDPADQAIVRVAVASDLGPGKLFDVVDDVVKSQFETVQGVGQVKIVGGRKREIQVLVDKSKLQDRQLSLLQISQKIANTSKDVPIGRVDTSGRETVMRATGEFLNLDELRDVNINFYGSDQGVKLSQVAQVQEGLVEETSASHVVTKNGADFVNQSAVFVDVFKQSGANTVEVVDLCLKRIDKVNKLLADKKIAATVTLIREGARPIRLNIADVKESIMYGIILCVIVVFFFLGSFRSTLITGMALPNSLLGAFIIMFAMGFTINILTLLALSLAVGLLIDDAIVVRENIFRHLEMGKKPMVAALEGTKEVSMAVIATTLVVIAVFGPIAFLQGMVGQFFKQFGLTVVFAMLISLFDAFTVAPMMSAYLASANEHKKGKGPIDRMLAAFDRFQTRLENLYVAILKWTMVHRLATLGSAVGIFIVSLGLVAFLPKTFIPTPDNAEFQVTIEKPVGTTIDVTKEFTTQIENSFRDNPSIELLSTVVGSNTGQPENNKSNIYVKLVPRKQRSFNTSQVKEQVREKLQPFMKDAIIGVGDYDISGGNQKVFNLNVTGENLDELSAYVDKLQARLKQIEGLQDVDTNYRTGKQEFQIYFDRNKSEALGVSTVTAGAELRARVEGDVAAVYRESGREYDIRIKLQDQFRDLRKEFSTTLVPNANFNMIPLSRVAEGKEKLGYSQINRQDKARYIGITSNLGPKGSLGDITTEVENLLTKDPEYKVPESMNYRFVGQTEDFKDLLSSMAIAMGLGVLFIYFVLASLYESFVIPFSILLALPMAISGAIVALLITGKGIDLFSLIGFVMLLGVVAKNSILLVDYANQLIDQGVERGEALIRSGRTRLRPILMTSFALIAGTIPIAIGLNEASAQRTSMGVAIIGGLISSTLLTLVVVPAAFGYIDDFRKWTSKMVGKIQTDNSTDIKPPHHEPEARA